MNNSTANGHVIQHTIRESRRAMAHLWIEMPDGANRFCVSVLESSNESADDFERRIEDEKKRISAEIDRFIPPVEPRHDVIYVLLIALRRWKAYAKVHENRDIAKEDSSEGTMFREFACLIDQYAGLNSGALVRMSYPQELHLYGPAAEEHLKKKKAGF